LTKKENIIEREQYYLDLYNPEYNILKVAGNSQGLIHRSDSIQKIREARLGFVHTKETRKAMSENRRGPSNSFYGKKHRDEVIQLLREIALNRGYLPKKGHVCTIFDTQSETTVSYPSIRSAAKGIGVPPSSILRYMKKSTTRKFKNRYTVTVSSTSST
jgi:group I intron endonuclease